MKANLPHQKLVLILFSFILSCCGALDNSTCEYPDTQLNLRVHIMRDITFDVQGKSLTNNHITPEVVELAIMPELNRIWAQGNIHWAVESIIEEEVNKPNNFERMKSIVENAVRDENGHADPARLVPLYQFQDPRYRSKPSELDGNLFHIYIYPFIGNTSQGNAMSPYGYHSVVGSWSNKSNGGRTPIKSPLAEDWNNFRVGSLSRTIAHELGHVLGLRHSDCDNCLMSGRGYPIISSQVRTANAEAQSRGGESCGIQ